MIQTTITCDRCGAVQPPNCNIDQKFSRVGWVLLGNDMVRAEHVRYQELCPNCTKDFRSPLHTIRLVRNVS